MSEPSWAAWIGERHVTETPAQKIYRQAQQGAERQERNELAAEAERAAEREDERDRRLLAFQQLGMTGRSLGDVFAEASRAADEDAAYQDALKTIERIDRKRARQAEAARFEAEQLAAVAQRSASADPFEAARSEAHQAFLQATRARWAEAQVRAPERGRPFAIQAARPVKSGRLPAYAALARTGSCATTDRRFTGEHPGPGGGPGRPGGVGRGEGSPAARNRGHAGPRHRDQGRA